MHLSLATINGNKWIFVGVDNGPEQFFDTLLSKLIVEGIVTDVDLRASQSLDGFLGSLKGIHGVAVGTSESSKGMLLESRIVSDAKNNGLKVVCFEDYMGSFKNYASGCYSKIVVESNSSKDCLLTKYQGLESKVIALNGLRYTAYKNEAKQPDIDPYSILWIGQPESHYCEASLRTLSSAFLELGVFVYIKSHPKDPQYGTQYYSRLLGQYGIHSQDISSFSTEKLLALGASFSISHFSSLSTLLASRGLPVMFALFPDIGQKLLLDVKGYDTPQLCSEGVAVKLDSVSKQYNLMKLMLKDSPMRKNIMLNAERYFTPGDELSRLIKEVFI